MNVPPVIPAFTAKEQELLNLILDGLSLKEISNKLDVSYKAVDFHRGNLYRKLGIQSMQELLLLFANKKIPESVMEIEQNISLPKQFVPAIYKEWVTFYDPTSTVNIITKSKGIYTLSGFQGKDDGYAGVIGIPDHDTSLAMKSMSMLSFKVLGDGKNYWVMLPTTDTKKDADHYYKPFSTQNGKITTITVNIKNDLVQFINSSTPKKFIQDNILYLEFINYVKESFNLMIWDIKLYP
jgi:DNA-binding CsgD family transcriptional regulator